MKTTSKQGGRCCDPQRKSRSRTLSCPINGEKGQRVSSETLRHLIKKARVHEVKDTGYYFCKTADCDTVYYHPEKGQRFQKEDLKVRVGCKECEDPVWVCYCFDISKKMIHEEIEATGKSSFGKRIRHEVAVGHCDCERLNPSGRCCLGEVLAAEKEARNEIVRQ